MSLEQAVSHSEHHHQQNNSTPTYMNFRANKKLTSDFHICSQLSFLGVTNKTSTQTTHHPASISPRFRNRFASRGEDHFRPVLRCLKLEHEGQTSYIQKTKKTRKPYLKGLCYLKWLIILYCLSSCEDGLQYLSVGLAIGFTFIESHWLKFFLPVAGPKTTKTTCVFILLICFPWTWNNYCTVSLGLPKPSALWYSLELPWRNNCLPTVWFINGELLTRQNSTKLKFFGKQSPTKAIFVQFWKENRT